MEDELQPSKLRQLVRFAIVGIVAALTYGTGVWIGADVMKWPVLPVNIVAWCLSIIPAYLGSYVWTFQSRVAHGAATFRYILTVLGGLVLSSAFVAMMQMWSVMSAGLAAFLFGFILWPPASFLIQKQLVFR